MAWGTPDSAARGWAGRRRRRAPHRPAHTRRGWRTAPLAATLATLLLALLPRAPAAAARARPREGAVARTAPRHRVACVAALVLACAGAPAAVLAQHGPGAGPGPAIRILDGTAFAGSFGPRGGDARDSDTFLFENGLFTSTGCIDYGFAPRPYWVREEGGVVHFLAEMVSEEHGTIVYTGRVEGDTIDATYVWTKDRWYWRVEREFWFKGRRVTER